MNVRAEDVQRFRGLVQTHLGLHFDDSKLDFLSEVLCQRLLRSDRADLDSYAGLLSNGSRDEQRALAEQLTVNETYFFRYWDHFRAYSEAVLPELMRARRATRRLRILSAGCASGEEPYSLAMLAREHVPEHDSWQIDILGVDINPAMVKKAQAARYSPWSLRTTIPSFAERHFQREAGVLTLDRSVVQAVSFLEGNVVEPNASFWQGASYDLVFCRNLLMYFTPEAAREVVARIASCLNPGGYLFLGHAETLRGLSTAFHLCHTHDTFYYGLRARTDSELEPRSRVYAAAAPVLAEADDASWVDVIRGASERIATLTTSVDTPAAAARFSQSVAPAAEARWDLAAALEMLKDDRFADALAALRALPRAATRDPEALLLRAVVLTNSGLLVEAEQVCGELLAIDELNAGAHYLTALCREHAGDCSAALEHDRTAAYLEDGFAMPHVHMGLLAARAGRTEEAQNELERALRLLARENAARILLFGGGFRREALIELCRSRLAQTGASP